MTIASRRDGRTVKQILFSRKREVDGWPSLRGGQTITYPASRNPQPTGYLSAMLCKSCVVALKGDVLEILEVLSFEGSADVYVQSRSQSGGTIHQCALVGNDAYLPRGNVTYHLGLVFLAQGLACPTQASDLLDALEEILKYPERAGAGYDRLLMHLADELYYWICYRGGTPGATPDRLDNLRVLDQTSTPAHAPLLGDIDPRALTDLEVLRQLRRPVVEEVTGDSEPALPGAQFRGPQLAELIESLELGMHCLLVGPTATGKSLCAIEAFDHGDPDRPVLVIEGHESLKEFDLLGGYTPDGAGGFQWNDGVLVRAMRTGAFMFIDEANRMPARTLNVLLGVLSRGAVVLTERGSEEVTVADGFQVVLAMNLGQGYAVNTLDRALLDRFPCVLEFKYLAVNEETDLLISETGLDRETATIMVKVANETRRLRKNRELSGELTPRGLFAWARKFQAKKGNLLDRLQDAASVTWLHQVAGVDSDGYLREEVSQSLLSLIEAHTSD